MPRVVLCFVLLLCLPGIALAADVMVHDAWIRQPPPGTNAAAYMTLHNRGESPRQLVGARSESAERVELHRTVIEDGVARMSPVETLEIPAGGRVELAPRGLHLMLVKPGTLREGDSVELSLMLDGGETVAAEVVVRKAAGGAGHHAGHH